MLVDRRLQQRARWHPENAKPFHHGNGDVIGHPWTHVILVIHDMVIPLPPLPDDSKPDGREPGLDYRTEHELGVASLNPVDRANDIGSYDPRDVRVLAERGDDKKKRENALIHPHGHFMMAGCQTRRVTSETLYLTTPQSKPWRHMATCFRHHRRFKWTPSRVMTKGAKRQPWRLASQTRWDICATSLRSNGWAPNRQNDRLVAARTGLAMIGESRQARFSSAIGWAGR